MKLLFDQNLSPHLVNRLSDLYPNSTHVSKVGLDRVLDYEIWEYAYKKGYTIVSKDSDFSELSAMKGSPPKVIWIRDSNYSTSEIENMMRRDEELIKKLESENKRIVLLY